MNAENASRALVLLSNLAVALQERYDRTGSLTDLEWTVELNAMALGGRPPGHEDRWVSLVNLSNALGSRFDRIGRHSDLKLAVGLHSEALALYPSSDYRVNDIFFVVLTKNANALHRRENRAQALGLLSKLAFELISRYNQAGSQRDLEWAIELNAAAAGLCPPGHMDRATFLYNLANVLLGRYNRTSILSDLDNAITLHTEVSNLPPPDLDRGMFLDIFAKAFISRYDRMKNLKDLERAIDLFTEALTLRPPGHRGRGASLNHLAVTLGSRYDRVNDLNDLEHAIRLYTEALTLRPPGHGERVSSLNNLADTLCTRYGRMNKVADIERAIDLYAEALTLLPPGHERRDSSLDNLAIAINTRYERTGSLSDLERVIELHTEVLELRPPDHVDRDRSLNSLANTFSTRYDRTGTLSDLERAIELHTEALALRPPGHKSRGTSLNNLAVVLTTRHGLMNDGDDSERSIELLEEVLLAYPHSSGLGLRGDSLKNLANALHSRYDRSGNLSDLERAIDLNTQALALCGPGLGDRSSCLNNLANALESRYNTASNIHDLERSIELHEEALTLCPLGHGSRGMYLTNLANAFSNRYERMGNINDLEFAIKLHAEALTLHPPGHGNRGVFLSNLADALSTRYKGMNDLDELQCSVKLYTDALAVHPDGYSDLVPTLGALAVARGTYHKRNTRDLDRVIGLYTEALALHPPDHKFHSFSLNNLASAIIDRFDGTGALVDLEEAIGLYAKALTFQPPGHEFRPSSLNNLAHALFVQYKRKNVSSNLEQSIKLYTECLALLPPGHMHRSCTIGQLSFALWCTKCPPIDKVFRLLKDGSNDLTSELNSSLYCARLWVQYGREVGDHESVSAAYDAIIHLLRQHLPLWPTMKLQYNALCQRYRMLEFPMDAAAHAIEIGDVERAVELLDVGRSFLWSELGRFKEPLLQSVLLDEKLVKDFEATCLELQNISTVEARFNNMVAPRRVEPSSPEIPYGVLLRRKRQLMDQYKRQLCRIKETPGFEKFLDHPSFEELQVAASDGPIIVINCSGYGSHVIIVFADRPPLLVQLDETFRETALRLYTKLFDGRVFRGHSDPFERVLTETAKFLWDDVVKDVVEKLKGEGIPEGSRIWWCPTSFLTALPFHAAGNKKHSLVDFYVSSYTPTLKSLIDARKPSSFSETTSQAGPQPRPGILVVAQTQDASNLPSARKELSVMQDLDTTVECLDKDKATTKSVLEQLQSTGWSHFICHGTLSVNPFDSSFILYKEKMSFNEIIKASLRDAKFAFLAACHTAQQSPFPVGLDNEVLHLAGAMYFSGFRSVVGTLWRMKDEDGPELARKFYEEMLRDDDTVLQKPRHMRAAYALWKVTKEMKNNKEMGADRWMNYVHIGA